MNQTNSLMFTVFIALGAVLVVGLVVIPAIEQQVLADNGNHFGHINK